MRGLAPKLLAAATLTASLALAAPALGAPAVDGIFKLETEIGTNNKIVIGPDGDMWFTLASATKDVGRITPAGAVTEYELPGIAEPIGIAPGPEGRLWVTGTTKATSFLPADPKGTEKTFNSALIAGEANIVFASDGMFWVASNEKVAKFSPADFNGTIKEVPKAGTLSPKDIDFAGTLIVIADNSAEKRIVTFSLAGVQKDFAIKGGSQGVAGAPDGQIAYSDPAAAPEESGLITPPNPPQSFELLGDPFGVTYGSDRAFWIAQFAAGGLTRVTPAGATTFIGGLPKETARQIAASPDNTLWVTLPKAGEPRIARITGLELPPPPGPPSPPPGPIPSGSAPPPLPETLLAKWPRKVVTTSGQTAKVKFSFSSSAAGAKFECSIGKRVKPKGKKARFVGKGFQACKSSKSYTLPTGRFRFEVRTLAGGLRDASPARFNFKVVRAADK